MTDLPIEPLVYTKDEFEKMKESPFIKEIMKHAIKLCWYPLIKLYININAIKIKIPYMIFLWIISILGFLIFLTGSSLYFG